MMNNLSEGFGIVVNETVFTRMMDAITDTEDKEIFENEFCPRLDDEYFLGFSIGFGEFYGIWKFTEFHDLTDGIEDFKQFMDKWDLWKFVPNWKEEATECLINFEC